jgi:hypothetical protein
MLAVFTLQRPVRLQAESADVATEAFSSDEVPMNHTRFFAIQLLRTRFQK